MQGVHFIMNWFNISKLFEPWWIDIANSSHWKQYASLLTGSFKELVATEIHVKLAHNPEIREFFGGIFFSNQSFFYTFHIWILFCFLSCNMLIEVRGSIIISPKIPLNQIGNVLCDRINIQLKISVRKSDDKENTPTT